METSVPRIMSPITFYEETKCNSFHCTPLGTINNASFYQNDCMPSSKRKCSFHESCISYGTNNENILFNTPKDWIVVISPQVEKGITTQRQLILERYRMKKQRRSVKKRLIYECRKKAADNRIRIKGRFASKAQLDKSKVANIKNELSSIFDEDLKEEIEIVV